MSGVDVLAVIRKLSKLAKHADTCSSKFPLPTGEGEWHCTCGLDGLVLDGEVDNSVTRAVEHMTAALRYVVDFEGQPMTAPQYAVVAKRARAALAAVQGAKS